ncbi:MAG TPA: hypothetical protein VER33_24925 [Polyangiaceae bacterium]|nr:hypothetical protein [Polyangiaceae bacterium]
MKHPGRNRRRAHLEAVPNIRGIFIASAVGVGFVSASVGGNEVAQTQ